MNNTVKDALAADLATMTRVVEVPSGNLGYGRDLSCVVDFASDYSEVDPQSTRALAEALIRRSITPRGALLDDRDYGTDVRGMLHIGVDANRLRMLGGQLRAEYLKDDRVDEATVTVAATDPSARSLRITATIAPADPALADFSFTFAVSDADVLIETISGVS